MKDRPIRSEQDLEEVVHTYADMLYRICLTMLKNPWEAEDVVQDTFLKYYQSDKVFESAEHRKAWLITVAVNECKNLLGFFRRHQEVSWEEWHECVQAPPSAESDILEALLKLPPKHRIVMTLYYVEEYKVQEIADILHLTTSAVKMRLQKGRKLLQDFYREGNL